MNETSIISSDFSLDDSCNESFNNFIDTNKSINNKNIILLKKNSVSIS